MGIFKMVGNMGCVPYGAAGYGVTFFYKAVAPMGLKYTYATQATAVAPAVAGQAPMGLKINKNVSAFK